jgi:hypothetical protein
VPGLWGGGGVGGGDGYYKTQFFSGLYGQKFGFVRSEATIRNTARKSTTVSLPIVLIIDMKNIN